MSTNPTQAQATDAGLRRMHELVALIASDSYAISFQTMGQYRTALLKAGRTIASQATTQPSGDAGAGAVPALWQFRWTNPGNVGNTLPAETAWKEVEPSRLQSMQDKVSELRAYKFDGMPCYEVRALSATPQVREEAALPDLGALKEQSEAWFAVVRTLNEVAPWWRGLADCGMDSACAAIRRCASLTQGTSQTAAPTESQRAALQEHADLGQEMGEYESRDAGMEVTAAMLRAAQLKSELGAHVCSEMTGAYSLIAEMYTVMRKAGITQEKTNG